MDTKEMGPDDIYEVLNHAACWKEHTGLATYHLTSLRDLQMKGLESEWGKTVISDEERASLGATLENMEGAIKDLTRLSNISNAVFVQLLNQFRRNIIQSFLRTAQEAVSDKKGVTDD